MRNLIQHSTRALALSFILFALACQTNQARQFERVKKGQEKGEVLEIMGSPDSTWRYKGQDRWTYRFYDEGEGGEDMRVEKQVHFEDGFSVYVGNPPAPEVSAAEQDARNEAANVAIEKALEEERRSRFKDMESYEESIRRDSQPARPLPTFQEIQ